VRTDTFCTGLRRLFKILCIATAKNTFETVIENLKLRISHPKLPEGELRDSIDDYHYYHVAQNKLS